MRKLQPQTQHIQRTNQALLPAFRRLMAKGHPQVPQSRLSFRSCSHHQLGPLLSLFLRHQLVPLLSMHQPRWPILPEQMPWHQQHHSGCPRLVERHPLHVRMSDRTPFSKPSHIWHSFLMIPILLHHYQQCVLFGLLLGLVYTKLINEHDCVFKDEATTSTVGTAVVSREVCHPDKTRGESQGRAI
jgi:hypothetical protein